MSVKLKHTNQPVAFQRPFTIYGARRINVQTRYDLKCETEVIREHTMLHTLDFGNENMNTQHSINHQADGH